MSRAARLRRWTHVMAIVLGVGFIFAAELFKKWLRPREATICSMVGWSFLLVAFLDWSVLGRGWRAALGDLARVALLSLVAGAVLFLYFLRSGTLDAGVDVDAAYSYIGLTWFMELQNPLAFLAPNPSYSQLPLMELGHLPALLIGFPRLGAFSPLLGTMMQVAILLAVMTVAFVPRRLVVQIPIAALAAAVFSDGMLVLSYNHFGYSIPAICIGLMFIVAVDDESVPDPDRLFGGLLLIAVLHHYSGLMQTLPIAFLWLLLRKRGLRRFPSFLARNPLLLASAALLLITLAIDPQPFTLRLEHVTIGPKGGPVLPAVESELITKMGRRWTFLVHAYPRLYYHQLFVHNGGSLPFVSIPPLGGTIGPLTVGAWLLSVVCMGRSWYRWVLYFVAFVLALLALSIVQHLLTDFADYRDLTALYALLVTALLFVFRTPPLGPVLRGVALCYALGFAVFNYVDLGKLHGKTHCCQEFAHVSQQTMQSLVAYLKRQPPQALGVKRIHVALDAFFPLGEFFLRDLARYEIPIQPIDAKEFCADQKKVTEAASAAGCDAFLLVTHTKRCPGRDLTDPAHPSRVRGYLYRSICDRPGAGLAERGEVSVALDE